MHEPAGLSSGFGPLQHADHGYYHYCLDDCYPLFLQNGNSARISSLARQTQELKTEMVK